MSNGTRGNDPLHSVEEAYEELSNYDKERTGLALSTILRRAESSNPFERGHT